MDKEIKTKKNRIDYFDIAKGMGMILVIIGHMPLKNRYLINFIYSFHMPLFFIISGYFFKYRENKECIKNIFKKLILPYFITCILIILYKIIILIKDGNYAEILNTLKIWGLASLYGSGSGQHFGIRFIGAIWFLLALSLASYIMNVIYKQKYRYLWVVLIAYVGYKTSRYIWLPLSMQVGMVALLFIYLGVLAKEKNILNKRIPNIVYIFSIFITVFCVFYCGEMSMASNYYKNGLMDIIGGVSGTFLFIKIATLIDKYTKIIKKCFIFIGKNSLLCMCIHLFSLDCLSWKTAHKLIKNIGINRFDIRSTIINIVFVVLTLVIIEIVKKIVISIKNRKSLIYN